jgi:glycosyltransferase involved in cell wall biosynthesis
MAISCIIPARNEAGHLIEVLNDVLSVKDISEIIIVEGGSIDRTYEEAIRISLKHPDKIKVVKQVDNGKFNAVMLGVTFVQKELVLIWDADGTVPIGDVKKIIDEALKSGQTVMGDRLRGNMEHGAMQFFNFLGNWAFAIAWIPILKQRPVDMLCGTKIVKTEIFNRIPKWLLKNDPYGDFSLIATAKHFDFSIKSIPVDYLARRYGNSNISRWSGGCKLLVTTVLIYVWEAKKLLKINHLIQRIRLS